MSAVLSRHTPLWDQRALIGTFLHSSLSLTTFTSVQYGVTAVCGNGRWFVAWIQERRILTKSSLFGQSFTTADVFYSSVRYAESPFDGCGL